MLQEAYHESAIMQLAKKYNGLALLWEHRYYGESLPFGNPVVIVSSCISNRLIVYSDNTVRVL